MNSKNHKKRPHSASLSIARSPSVLASTNLLPSVPLQSLDPSCSFETLSATSNAWKGKPLGKSISNSGAIELEAIQSVEDLIKAPDTVDALVDPENKSHIGLYKQDVLEDYPSAPLLQHATYPPRLVDVEREPVDSNELERLERLDGTALEYTGPFQPPDSKELFMIILSFTGVFILAVAAGLTTIFDWVL
ncbi:uncharacterized protein L203_100111 [Cryptococcus depauperatus CBS 7841]|uniref:Uncharacterized protein n=1 Tax=Cryptococcus depauperatus CBS 7841 TaxID=1295531 RepID=A0A1E3J269_9TREE|nr:hypothetical protein L203_00225 [Cryptococcus depauperatus CBS 7841]